MWWFNKSVELWKQKEQKKQTAFEKSESESLSIDSIEFLKSHGL